MPSFYKTARRWEREHEAAKRKSGAASAPDLTFYRDKTGGFSIPVKRAGGSVPTTTGPRPANPGISGLPTSPAQPYKRWKDLPNGGSGGAHLPNKWRGLGGGALGFLMDNADDLARWGRDDWDKFMEDGTLPPGLDFLNPSGDVRKKWMDDHFPGMPTATPDQKTIADILDGVNCSRGTPAVTLVPPGIRVAAPYVLCNSLPEVRYRPSFPDRVIDGTPMEWHPYGTTGVWPPVVFPAVSLQQLQNIRAGATTGTGAFAKGTGWTLFESIPRFGTYDADMLSRPNQPIAKDNVLAPGTPLQRFPTGTLDPQWVVNTGFVKYRYMPLAEWSGYQAPNPNISVRMRHAPYLKTAQILAGNRFDSGYNPDKPAWHRDPGVSITVPLPSPNRPPPKWTPPPVVITKPSEPYKPPGSKNDRKAVIRGRALFQAVQKGFHALTEYNDFIESFYDALPKKYQTCKVGGPACKTLQVTRHFDEVDIPTAVVNWAWNNFEDAVLGRGFRSLDNAAKRLGTRDWKLLNSANDSPLDEGLGELYGEFIKEHVNPTKEDFVKYAKENWL